MVKKADLPDHIIDTALTLAAERGWLSLGLADIAEAATVSLSVLHQHYRSKDAILEAYARRVDTAVLDAVETERKAEAEAGEAPESPRDRLFDVLMRRFDAMTPHKPAIKVLAKEFQSNPLAACSGAGTLFRSMDWMLEAAGIESTGLKGMVRSRGLAGVWVATLADWVEDETEDQSETMASLDRYLRRAEAVACWTPFRRPAAREAPAAPAT